MEVAYRQALAALPEPDPALEDAHGRAPERGDAPEAPQLESAPASGPFHWLIDNGHGRLQPGKRSPVIPDRGVRFAEWRFNRIVARRLVARLADLGIPHTLLVPEDEVGAFLRERVARANALASALEQPTFFVSIHANAAPGEPWVGEPFRGVSTYHFGNRAAEAGVFQRHLEARAGLPRFWRGVLAQPFYVLRYTSMPALLTECGFFTHEEEVRQLLDPGVQERLVEGHLAAIRELDGVAELA